VAASKSKLMAGSRSNSGFTLIELLTVIAIIGLLAGLLLPAAATAVAAARSASCQSNLHAWGVALMCYVSRTGGYIPRRGQGIQPTFVINRDDDWFNCLAEYVNDTPYKQRAASGVSAGLKCLEFASLKSLESAGLKSRDRPE